MGPRPAAHQMRAGGLVRTKQFALTAQTVQALRAQLEVKRWTDHAAGELDLRAYDKVVQSSTATADDSGIDT